MTMNDITRREIIEAPELTGLQRTLLEENIPVFDNDAVRAYQAKALEKRIRRMLWPLFAILAALFVSGLMGIAGAVMSSNWPWWQRFAAYLAGGVLMLFCCQIFSQALHDMRFRSSMLAAWHTVSLSVFLGAGGKMPAEIMTRADLCEGYYREVQFLADDPFLFVRDPEDYERYCIGVWDEKGFR